ncbi:MAG: hypothetical protein Q4A17_09325 [Thermoguttaceae bacterium]|nr:hypothetical protein [Thermoguttaceae bacterium]
MRLTFLFVFVLFLVSAAHAQTDWYTVDRDVVNRLVFEEKDRLEWLAELQAKPEKTAADELRIFQLAARSGDEAAALAALERFIAMENPKPGTLYGLTHWASKTLQNPALARHLAERFPQLAVGNPSLQDFFPSELKTDPEMVRLWIDARFQDFEAFSRKSSKSVPKADPSPAPVPFWLTWNRNPWTELRIQAFRNAGKIDELLDALQAGVQNAPDEPARTAALLAFLKTVLSVSAQPGVLENRDLTWVRGCPPAHAVALLTTAQFLIPSNVGEFETAYDFLLKALKTPLTQDEIEREKMNYSAPSALISDETIRNRFQAALRHELTEVCRAMNRPEETQKWMLEEKEWAEKCGGMNYRHAGQIQAFTGQRVVEKEIREKEKVSENSPQYWEARAGYYAGRGKECEKELEEALLRGLTFPDDGFLRRRFLQDLVRLWYSQDRKEEVQNLLREELRTAPKNAQSRQGVIWIFVDSTYKGILEPDFPEVWDWFAETDDWNYLGERLIWRIFQIAEENEPENLETYYARAEKLADRPERAAYLGWVLNRMHEPERSLPLLRLGAQASSDQVKEYAAFTLLESLMDLHRWDEAFEYFPTAAAHLTTDEIPGWLARIGGGASEDGNDRVAEVCARRLRNLKASISPAGE